MQGALPTNIPVWVELFRILPVLGVTVDRCDWNDDLHSFGNGQLAGGEGLGASSGASEIINDHYSHTSGECVLAYIATGG